MIVAEAWLPQLPPIHQHRGWTPSKHRYDDIAPTHEWVMIELVNVAEIIKISSHGMRFL